MAKNSFLQALFSGPKFSLAPIEKNNRGSVFIGKIVPVYANILNPREGIELNMSHLVRFLPAKAPVMEGYKVTFDAFAVPYSALGYAERKERDIDDFFNLKQNEGLIENPFCFSMYNLQYMLSNVPHPAASDDNSASLANAFRLGSLCDFINFPSLKNVREHVRKWLQLNGLLSMSLPNGYVTQVSDVRVNASSNLVALALVNDNVLVSGSYFSVALGSVSDVTIDALIGVPFCISDNPFIASNAGAISNPLADIFYTHKDDNDLGYSSLSGAYSLFGYIVRNYPAVASYYHYEVKDAYLSIQSMAQNMNLYLSENSDNLNFDFLQVLYDNYKVDAQSIYNEYFEYIMSLVLYNINLKNNDEYRLWTNNPSEEKPFLPWLPVTEPIDLSYLAAYWKIISDWYINTNIDGDPDDFFLANCNLLTDAELSTDRPRFVNTEPFVRRWANDVFTSAVPMAQVQNIRIPADGTIPDLRDANAFQKLKDILRNTGNRLRDVIFGIRGARASAVRSEMSEPIATSSSWVGFQSILQTSQTTPDSPQAAYSGIGTDSSGFKRFFKYINNEEPTPVIIMVLMSITQRSSYMQGFDRSFFRKSIYDFAVPQLAMIGEQEVTNKEIYFDKDYKAGTFGFNRRYYDWFMSQSEVHGELRDTMDYWHGARVFDEQPALNSEFIGINAAADHLQRIFANVSESAPSIIYNIAFDGYATRALPRYIQYEL